ncbi:ParB/RepB/Spo0J family partition protein [Streptomyces sp. LHD-70]|uniref:ParB/RepB/Spo0J family partition protein n=1 Tax=Streptomyces sp. LHD-70 TaxID=3072140 RepID=UPI00280E77A0|nr:ParB/RepB/Spo0J family partition protein [Streptomyces sp. LHD-70]MDQ8706812.1 ParB/RepB/Spo0J family partition protein [Streptomyces sp. LHD-70]
MNATKTEVLDIPLDQVEPNPDQPRKFFDEGKLKELAAQFEEVGQLQPIVVRRPKGKRKFQIIMGERRWRAMHLVDDATTIKGQVVKSVDDEKAFVMSISENVGRADMTLMEEAQAYADLVGFGHSAERIAEMFGKTPDYVKWRMDLLNLTTDIAALVADGKIKPDFAWHLSRLTPANQKAAVIRYMKGDFRSETDASTFAQAMRMKEKQEGFFSDKELSEKEKEEKVKERKQAKGKVDHVERAGALLQELAGKTPTELAELFEGEVGKHLDAIERVRKAAAESVKKLRKAKAMSEAKQLTVRPDLKVDGDQENGDERDAPEADAVVAEEPTEAELAEAARELAELTAAAEQELSESVTEAA